MFRIILFSLLFLSFMQPQYFSQARTDAFLKSLLDKNKNPLFQQIIKDAQTYRVQIIYTQIDRNKNNKPSFKNYYFNYDPNLYFNPASMVKMPLAFLALEKLNTINKPGLNKYTTALFDSSQAWQHPLLKDLSTASGKPTIAHLIKRAFLISENDPYNRLYQFVGQKTINKTLHKKGYKDVRITRQFLGLSEEQNRHTNAVRFVDDAGNILHGQPPAYNKLPFDFGRQIKLGTSYMNSKDEIINEPFDFTKHNNISLLSMQQMLQSIMFPKSVTKKQRFSLTEDDLNFLYQYLSQYPSETPDPKYDEKKFYDSYVKFFFRSEDKKMPEGVRVFNKVGWSYGFLTDVSYVADFKNGVEYMLAATLYVNDDGILNDGKYEYDAKGYPFLYQLGQTIYNYELGRKRKQKPDLSRFTMSYEKRDPNDKRPVLSEVDN